MAGRDRRRDGTVTATAITAEGQQLALEETYQRDELLRAYLGSLCGSVTEYARKLPRGVSTDLSEALALFVADDLAKLLGVATYRKESQAEIKSRAKQVGGSKAKAQSSVRHPSLSEIWVGEIRMAGGIKPQQLDIVLSSPQQGLALGLDVKGLNTRENAGKNFPNRIGDFIATSVNFHLKFPYAVMGGVLAVPGDATDVQLNRWVRTAEGLAERRSPADAAQLFEGFALLVFDCETLDLSPSWPAADSPVRYENFVKELAAAYERRFRQG